MVQREKRKEKKAVPGESINRAERRLALGVFLYLGARVMFFSDTDNDCISF